MIRKLIHRAICWYLRKCAGAFHTYPYGETGRYVVLMRDDQYHYWDNVEWWQVQVRNVCALNDRLKAENAYLKLHEPSV